MSKFTVFLDANILYSWNLNHILMFCCDTGVGLIEPYWSDAVVEEAVRNICKNNPNEYQDNVKARFEKMNIVYPYANVTGYEKEPEIEGVHADDQHVAKAVIFNQCDFLVSNNFKHFKNAERLSTLPKVVTADTLLTALAKKYPDDSLKATVLAWWHLKNSDDNYEQYLSFLGRNGNGLELVNFEKNIREIIKAKSKTYEVIASEITINETKRY